MSKSVCDHNIPLDMECEDCKAEGAVMWAETVKRIKAEERERCIAALLAVNPMEVSWCDDIHGDGWWNFKVREVLERDA